MDDLPAQGLPQAGQNREPGRPEIAETADSPAEEDLGSLSQKADGRLTRLRRVVDPRTWANSPRWGDARRWRWRATALALTVALVLGFSGAAPRPNAPDPDASVLRTAAASSTDASTGSAPSLGLGTPSHGPSVSGSTANPLGRPSTGPIPAQTSPTATVTFNDLILDSSADTAGSARTFSFVSDGPGGISAEIVATSPMDSTRLCVTVDETPAQCVSGATPGWLLPTATAHSRWTVTLSSVNESSPTVDVAFSWPTDHPSIVLTHGRFQGYPNPDSLRSLTATFLTRAAGLMSIDASWPPATLDATLTVADVSGAKPTIVDRVAYSGRVGISPAYSHALKAGERYQMTLMNDSPEGARPNLTATVTFP